MDKTFFINILIYIISSIILITILFNSTLVPNLYINNPNYKIDTLIHIHKNDTMYKYKFVKISNYERER